MSRRCGLFRLPGESQFLFFEHRLLGRSDDALFCSFDLEKKVHLSDPEPRYISDLHLFDFSNIDTDDFEQTFLPPDKEEYLEKIIQAINTVKENDLPKLVISRQKIKEISGIDIVGTLENLANNFPSSLVYLFYYENEIWIGATPELLGKFNKKTKIFQTMSLAGTVEKQEKWTKKELAEQKAVTTYIEKIIQKFGENIKISDTTDYITGKIKHLRTDFTAEIEEERLTEIIDILHPTPAVCGVPKEFCRKKIQEIENYPREFYTGYIKIESRDEIFYFVNLRCAKISKRHIISYVGGGVTSSSDPEKEWTETEMKSLTIFDNVKHI